MLFSPANHVTGNYYRRAGDELLDKFRFDGCLVLIREGLNLIFFSLKIIPCASLQTNLLAVCKGLNVNNCYNFLMMGECLTCPVFPVNGTAEGLFEDMAANSDDAPEQTTQRV
jgi:hypothetical protein